MEYEWWKRLFRKKWPFELFGSVPPLLVALLGAAKLLQESPINTLGYYAAGAAIWLLVASILKIVHTRELDKDANAKRDHDGLKAAMSVVQASTIHACNLDPASSNDVRVTFHRVVPPLDNPQHIEQLIPYAGGDGGGEGRKFSVRSGITGRCIRTKELYIMHRPDNDVASYQRQLEADWGYTQSDVKKLSTDKLSYMVVPVLDASGKHALGVIYIDSVHINLFETEEARNAIFQACVGVTKYVSERYGK